MPLTVDKGNVSFIRVSVKFIFIFLTFTLLGLLSLEMK